MRGQWWEIAQKMVGLLSSTVRRKEVELGTRISDTGCFLFVVNSSSLWNSKKAVLVCYGCLHKVHKGLGVLNNKHLFHNSSRGQKSKIKVSAGLVLPRNYSLTCRRTSSLCLSSIFPLWVCVLITSCKDINLIGVGVKAYNLILP